VSKLRRRIEARALPSDQRSNRELRQHNRALNELMHHYTIAEEKSRLVLTRKSGDMKLFLHDIDDLHQLDFVHNQQMVRETRQRGEAAMASFAKSWRPE
jgi:hypothetical protein